MQAPGILNLLTIASITLDITASLLHTDLDTSNSSFLVLSTLPAYVIHAPTPRKGLQTTSGSSAASPQQQDVRRDTQDDYEAFNNLINYTGVLSTSTPTPVLPSSPTPPASTTCSNASSSEEDLGNNEETIWTPAVIQRVATICVCMAFALVGNTAIILVLTCSRYRKRSSRVNIFIIHLAIGDLTVCFCTMTTEILFVAFGQWVLGPALCKILPYLQCITLASTTFILTSMSFDRYLAICKPLRYRATTTRAKRFICVSWALAFVLTVPQLFIFVQTEECKGGRVYYQCKSRGYTAQWQRKLYFSFFTLYIMVVPIILISFCYVSIVCVVSKASRVIQREGFDTRNRNGSISSRNSNSILNNSSIVGSNHLYNNNNFVGDATGSDPYLLRRSGLYSRAKSTFPRAKIKTLKMTFAIIATFVVCWTPYFVTTLTRIYSDYKVPVPEQVMAFVETIALFQSASNPLIYGCFNIKMKCSFKDMLCCLCPSRSPNTSSSEAGGRRPPEVRDGRPVDMIVHHSQSCRCPSGLCMSMCGAGQYQHHHHYHHHHHHHHHRPTYEMKLYAPSNSTTPKSRRRLGPESGSLLSPSQASSYCSGLVNSIAGGSSNASKSDSINSSVDRMGRVASALTVTEENKNGVRLRVRFARRKQCRCLSSDGLNRCSNVSDTSVPYDLLLHTSNHGGQHTVGARLTMYKPHSLQQLYP